MNKRQKFKTLILASLGAGLEWFDFTIYILFAHYISVNFFQSDSALVALIKTFGTFALGYLARPVGGIFFGHMGDKYGRKTAFTLSVFLMAFATMFIGFIPSYKIIGVFAPMSLIFLRLVQGFSVGGEIPSATVFTLEHFKQEKPGLLVGVIFMSITFGNLLASLMGFLLSRLLSNSQLLAWGWRIPFILGFILGLVSYFLRRRVIETPEFLKIHSDQLTHEFPVFVLFKSSFVKMINSVCLTALPAATIFIFLYMATYATNLLSYAETSIYLSVSIGFFMLGILCPVSGLLSDIFKRNRIVIIGSLAAALVSIFLFEGLIQHTEYMPWIFVIVIAMVVALVNGVYAIMIAETFHVAVRASGLGFCYNLGLTLFGGIAPLLLTALIKITHNLKLPAYYFLICACITLFSAMTYHRDADNTINQ